MDNNSKPNESKNNSSQLEKVSSKESKQAKILDGLVLLANAFAETVTEARLEAYLAALDDLTLEQFSLACNRAMRELKFFPKIAELRTLALGSADERKIVEAEAAWRYVNEYLRKWGVERLPLYRNGEVISAPRFDERIDYALRRIGGLWALNQVTSTALPFMHRDFCEAYDVAPRAPADSRSLIGAIEQLAAMDVESLPVDSHGAPIVKPKPMERTTDFEKRREELKAQLELLRAVKQERDPK